MTDNENDMLQRNSVSENRLTTDDDDETIMTYVDEHRRNTKPKLKYHLGENGNSKGFRLRDKDSHDKERKAWEYYKIEKNRPLSKDVQENEMKSQRKSNREQKIKLLDKTWASMVKSLKYGPREDKIEINSDSKESEDVTHDFTTMAKDRVKEAIQNKILTVKSFPTRPSSPKQVSSERTRNIKISKNTEKKQTSQAIILKESHPKSVRHASLAHKDGGLDIVNAIPDNLSLSEKANISKPRFIHSKIEAIEEIVKALGSKNKIVKDANGLYLITGKHVKIIERTHKNKTNKGLSFNGKFETPKIRSRLSSKVLTPVLTMKTGKPSESIQRFAQRFHEEMGVPLFTFNVKDLEKKLRKKITGTDEDVNKNKVSGKRTQSPFGVHPVHYFEDSSSNNSENLKSTSKKPKSLESLQIHDGSDTQAPSQKPSTINGKKITATSAPENDLELDDSSRDEPNKASENPGDVFVEVVD